MKYRVLVAVAALLTASEAAAQPTLSGARALYSAASYEEALGMLNALHTRPSSSDEARLVEQYRGFTLMALGRTSDAETAFAAIVAASPFYVMPSGEASPRVRAVFDDVRRRMLPDLVRQSYTLAKNAFNDKNFSRAADLFAGVLLLLDDPAFSTPEAQKVVAEYRTLATDYHDLSLRSIPPPAPAVEELPVARETPIYDSTTAGVVAPVVVRQALPAIPPRVVGAHNGVIEVVISEAGVVESAVMRTPLHATYDPLALEAARAWTYKPATRNGVPVKYRKFVQITVKP